MHLSLTALVVMLVLLIVLFGFFSSAEISLMSINRYRLRHLVKKRNKKALRVQKLLGRPDKLLSVILIGNTVVSILASMLATLIGQTLYGDIGIAIATLLLTFVILVFAELVPKTLAALHAQAVAFFISRPLSLLQKGLMPLVSSMSWIANALLRCCGVDADKLPKETLSRDEFHSVVHETGGWLPHEHRGMLLGLLDLEKATVEDIMVPKSEIMGLDVSEPWHVLLEQLETAQHTRLPVYEETIDHLLGMVHVRQLLALALEKDLSKETLLNAAEPPYFIPEGTPLNKQILHFQKMKQRSSFVVDEYGDLQGLVTLEDILEEVVGEFTSDMASLSKEILPQEDGSVIVDASITLRQLKRLLGWQLPVLGPRTLSGLIIEYLGYIPPAACCLRLGEYTLEILKVSDNLIKTVRMDTYP